MDYSAPAWSCVFKGRSSSFETHKCLRTQRDFHTMKKRGGVAVEILMLWCLLLPTTIWAGSIYGPSGVYAAARWTDLSDIHYPFLMAGCNSGLVPLAASCVMGPITGLTSDGDAFSASASGYAAAATGGLTARVYGGGPDDIQVDGGASVGDTIYFHGGNAQQTGTMTMTATGTSSGNGFADEFLHVAYYKDFGPRFGNGPWVLNAQAWTNQPGSGCDSGRFGQVCEASDGQLLTVSVTFPLADPGVFLLFSLSARSFGDGLVDYTDPITLTLPPGVTFTSESGVFLTQQEASPVPEPSSALLLGIGMAGIVGLRQTRRRVSRSLCWFSLKWRAGVPR